MEHTPDPQPTVYEGILFVWGFGDAWGLLQGVCWNFLRNNVFFNLISFPARSPLCMHHVYARAERIQIQPPALFDERCWRPSCSTNSATPRPRRSLPQHATRGRTQEQGTKFRELLRNWRMPPSQRPKTLKAIVPPSRSETCQRTGKKLESENAKHKLHPNQVKPRHFTI